MTQNTEIEPDDKHSPLKKLGAIARVTLVMMFLLSTMTGTVAAQEEPSEEELCSNALTDIIDRVMFFVFNLAPIVTFTAFGGAFAMEKLASSNSKRSEYREWRNRAGVGTAGLLIIGQMGGWFMETFLNVSPACLDNFTHLMLQPVALDALTMMPS